MRNEQDSAVSIQVNEYPGFPAATRFLISPQAAKAQMASMVSKTARAKRTWRNKRLLASATAVQISRVSV
jgi:hypothetical protein